MDDVVKNILLVIGTRPEAIKLAPLLHELKADPHFRVRVCVTSQHRDLLAPMLAYFDIKPDVDLGVMTPGQTLTEVTTKVLAGVEKELKQFPCDIVVVQGDTTTAFAAGLAAYQSKVKVAHVEAGLRSGNLDHPYPEEANRRMVDLFADYHFAPTQRARDNLVKEGCAEDRVFVTGNTAIDALLASSRRLKNAPSPLLEEMRVGDRLVLVTAHRRESFDGGLDRICRAIVVLSRRFPKATFVYPVHSNPQVRKVVGEHLTHCQGVKLVAPLNYPDFVQILSAADLVLTDSGGVQEEAPALGKRVLVLRETTERPEGIECGAAELVGADLARIVERASYHLKARPRGNEAVVCPYGDGFASERIAEVLRTGALERPFIAVSRVRSRKPSAA